MISENIHEGVSRRHVLSRGALAGAALARPVAACAQQPQSPAAPQVPSGEPIFRAIPSSGEQLPVIGVGTYGFGASNPAEVAARREVLARLPDLGGKVIDTAQVYDTEDLIGEQIQAIGNRDKVFIATKTPWGGDFSNPQGVIDRSFRALRTERIDLLQVHNLAGLDRLMPAYLDYKRAGKVRYIGATTYHDGQYGGLADAMERYPLDFVQVDYSIDDTSAERRILSVAQAKGIAVLINMPFGGRYGENLMTRSRGKALPGWAAEIGATSWAQFFLKFIISHPAVTVAIPGTTKVRHLEDNLLAGRGPLPDPAMRKRMQDYWKTVG
jgi:aryl-alcohol dehydrogenase-like predicted oxidoreductase